MVLLISVVILTYLGSVTLHFLVVLLHNLAYFPSWGVSNSKVIVDESEEESEDERLRFLLFLDFFTRGTFLRALVDGCIPIRGGSTLLFMPAFTW